MDSWIKRPVKADLWRLWSGFNPCFNGFMDKEMSHLRSAMSKADSFNPCFNGFMDKEHDTACKQSFLHGVSILVLMDSWIKSESK